MLGGGKKKAVGSDVRNLLVEKVNILLERTWERKKKRAQIHKNTCNICLQELLESQLRKCHVEVSTLQTENKSLKHKYNRAQGKTLFYLFITRSSA